jgi:branched-subunit amino acid aminotransferase/4-amino-4-deoxychorismate lyase
VKAPRITLPVDAPALARGVGFFETLWVLDRRPVFFEAHLARLRTSCAALGVPGPRPSRVRDASKAALRGARRGEEYGMRWSYLAVGHDLDRPRSWRFFAMLFPVPREILRKRRGVRAVLLPRGWERTTPRWKTIDYRASIAGARLARGRAAEEGIFLDEHGRVREGTASNVFLLSGRRAATAPVSASLLPGVVRSWVLENAPRVGLAIEERSFPAVRLRRGGFFTSSLTGIAPIESLDGVKCAPPPPILAELRALYRRTAEEAEFR